MRKHCSSLQADQVNKQAGRQAGREAGERVAAAAAQLTHDIHQVLPDERLSSGQPELAHAVRGKELGQLHDLVRGEQLLLWVQGNPFLRHAIATCNNQQRKNICQ